MCKYAPIINICTDLLIEKISRIFYFFRRNICILNFSLYICIRKDGLHIIPSKNLANINIKLIPVLK